MDNPIQVIDGFKDSCFTFGHHVGHNCQVPCLDLLNGKNLLTFGSLFNLGSKLDSLALMARWVILQAVISQSGGWDDFYKYWHDRACVWRDICGQPSPSSVSEVSRGSIKT